MKKKIILWLAVMTGIVVMTACGQKENKVKTEKSNKEKVETIEEKQSDEKILSDDLFDFQISMDGKIISFPIKYSELTKLGWKYTGEDQSIILADDEMISDWFKNGNDMTMTYLCNFNGKSEMVLDSYISGIIIARDYIKNKDREIILSKGLKLGESTLEETIKTYGEPTRKLMEDRFPTLYYELNHNQFIELVFDSKENDVLSEITIKNRVLPRPFKFEKKQEEASDKIERYEEPISMSYDLFENVIIVDENLYRIPAPVSCFVKNGWKIVKGESDLLLEAQTSGQVVLMKENRTFRMEIVNQTEHPQEVLQCVVDNINVNQRISDVHLEIAHGIKIGMSQADLEKKIKKYEYTKKESSYTYYDIVSPGNENAGYEIIVKDETVIGIEIKT